MISMGEMEDKWLEKKLSGCLMSGHHYQPHVWDLLIFFCTEVGYTAFEPELEEDQNLPSA